MQAKKITSLAQLLAWRKIRALKNLDQLLAPFPNHGVGFKISMKHWPAGNFYLLKSAKYNSFKKGQFFGLYFQENKQVGQFPVPVKKPQARGVWRFQTNGAKADLTNGVSYDSWEIEQQAERMKW